MLKKICLISILLYSALPAQGLEETLFNLAGDAAFFYLSPVASAFGSNLNTGWISEIPVAGKSEFNISLSFAAGIAFFRNEPDRFSLYGNHRLSVEAIDRILANSGLTVSNPEYYKYKAVLTSVPQKVFLSGPTVIGSKSTGLEVFYPGSEIDGVKIESYRYTVKEVNGYLDGIKYLPSASLQLNIGSYCGSILSLRYLPPIEIESLGKFSYWGIGFLHNPGGWFGIEDYVDTGLGFFHQKMTVGSLFNSSATQFVMIFGKTYNSFIRITPQVGINYEISKTVITYNYEYRDFVYGVPISVTRPVGVEFSGRNKITFTTGILLGISTFNIKLDYKLAPTPTFSTSATFKIL